MKCGARKQIDLEIAEPKNRHSFRERCHGHAGENSVLAAAAFFNAGWGLENSILKERLNKKHPRKLRERLRRIAIDETSAGKRHNRMAIAMGLDA